MKEFKKLVEILAKLRSKDGCQWDREQTHESLLPYVIEESHEVCDAIESKNPVWLKEELGDLLLQIIFHSQIASENNEYNIKDVILGLSQKLIRRHPHVFADASVENYEQLDKQWNKIKVEEKKVKGSREENRSASPLLKPEIIKAILKKKGISEKVFDSKIQVADISKYENKEKAIGDTLFLLIIQALSEGIDPERALWKSIESLKTK